MYPNTNTAKYLKFNKEIGIIYIKKDEIVAFSNRDNTSSYIWLTNQDEEFVIDNTLKEVLDIINKED